MPDVVAEQLRARTDHAGEISRGVDDRLPLAAAEPVDPAVAVADDSLELRIEVGGRRAPVEERELVPTLERRVDHGAPEELRAAEQEEPHRSSAMPASSRSTSSAVL